MPIRKAVLLGECDKRVGAASVPETTFAIRHKGETYIRTEQGIRLPGGGIGAVFVLTDVLVRDSLDPA